jgi:hypothetical protein
MAEDAQTLEEPATVIPGIGSAMVKASLPVDTQLVAYTSPNNCHHLLSRDSNHGHVRYWRWVQRTTHHLLGNSFLYL